MGAGTFGELIFYVKKICDFSVLVDNNMQKGLFHQSCLQICKVHPA